MKIQLFKKEKNFKKKNFQLNPNLYWKIAVFGALIIMILSFFFGYSLFAQINKEPVATGGNGNGGVPTVNEDRLKKDLDYFYMRAQKSNQILNSPSPIIDPSL